LKRKIISFTAPREIEILEEAVNAPGANEVLVESICSSISAGTEMLVYRGQFPTLIDSSDEFSSDLKYPTPYGYSCAGIVREIGSNVDKSLRDKLVFGFYPHASHFLANKDSLILAPESFAAETCCFLPNMETAVNLVQDAAPIIGERVLVMGQGILGLLVSSLLKQFPIELLVTSDCYERRRNASIEIGAEDSYDPLSIGQKEISNSKHESLFAYAQAFDLTFELSGSPSALNDAIKMTTFSGRIVIGSWYGEKKFPIDLGGTFHRSRIKLIASQVSTIAPELSGRWDKDRRFKVAWDALEQIQPQKWITHRFSIDQAYEAYRLLDEDPEETLQVVFDYKL